ncbi:hypothetical protein AC578_2378 [Pseudocercospora eumusae]|uniref:Rap-GAP domain-containing protein n=1 Tax=Pseudocercospora eumusae TaxID=321146 RepID=A0A139HXD8_9PEZI|nr:hypothetical protein AC578_2378 [Pseudocercospora eumusae]
MCGHSTASEADDDAHEKPSSSGIIQKLVPEDVPPLLSSPASVESSLPSPHPLAFRLSNPLSHGMDSSAPPDIAPHEASICEQLTRKIILCNAARSIAVQSPGSPSAKPSLAAVLHEASTIIRYHAKWFAPPALDTLLQHALDVASTSSSTTDLYAALTLIDTIGIYSLIPTLLPPVRFIAYAYYQGSRSNRHRKLTQHAWVVAQHIIESHLGRQFTDALLEVISDHRSVLSKHKFAATIGALMITTNKLLPDRHISAHALQPIQLLLGLQKASVEENAILREQVIVLVGTMLRDEAIANDIASDGGLGLCLELVSSCVAHALDRETLDFLFVGLEPRIGKFELRHQPDLARLFVDARRPLPSPLSKELLVPWQRYLMLDELEMWESGYRELLGKLSDSSLYLEELEEFINISVSVYFQSDNTIARREFVLALHRLIQDKGTAVPAVELLARGLVRIFTYKTQKEKWEAQRNWLFPLLCKVARYSVEVTRMLLSVRADAAGEGYLSRAWTTEPSNHYLVRSTHIHGLSSLSLSALTESIHDMITRAPERWEVYNTFLKTLPALVRNHALWHGNHNYINSLRTAICEHLIADSFVDPPTETALTKSYIVAQLIQILTATISYHHRLLRNDIKTAIVTIINVAGSRDHSVSVHCIHALTISCYELPEMMAGYMDAIINKMARMVTQRNLALYVLEFFAGLSRFPDLQDRLRREDFKRIFGVCHRYLQSVRSTSMLERKRTPTSEQSAGLSSANAIDDMAQYVYALAHHVITFWYMALRKEDRHGLKEYITSCLKYTDIDGTEHIEDQGLVTIDLMDRVDADEINSTALGTVFDTSDGRIITRHRVTGILVITTETALRTGKTIVTIRRPSGSAQRLLSSHMEHELESAEDVEARFTASVTVENDTQDYISVFPDDITGRTYGKVAIPRPSSALGSLEIITLPEDDAVMRAIQMLDRTPALDSHKAGVIFVGEEQTCEDQILLNTSGTPDYREFLEDLGSLRKLKDAKFNSQGLDRAMDADGAYTMVYNNEVTELVYHITTFMPNDAHDPKMSIINKKRHIGNDFVNIVFNTSGHEFDFNTFPSAFNYVYIVITPSERTSFLQAREFTCAKDKKERFYNVRVLNRPGFPSLSSAGERKVISGASLGGYVRNLALNACVFSLMWQQGDTGEYPSSWRQRLQMIRRLHQYRARTAS